jgi:hypothetical protein
MISNAFKVTYSSDLPYPDLKSRWTLEISKFSSAIYSSDDFGMRIGDLKSR